MDKKQWCKHYGVSEQEADLFKYYYKDIKAQILVVLNYDWKQQLIINKKHNLSSLFKKILEI